MENGNIKSRSGMSLTVRQAVNSFIGRARPDRNRNIVDYVGVAPDLYARYKNERGGDPEQQPLRMTCLLGFTLVELLVVVLIIGVLSAIAIPMYQGAVDKSHWSTMLPGAKAIKDAEEAIKMTNGSYTDEMANLDVTMNNSDLTFALVTPNNTADPNVIRVTNSKLANVRLASYLDDSPKFAGQLHCEALKNDERANKLCDKLLMGQELTEQDGYVGYLLDQEITKNMCGEANRSWSTSKNKCYATTADKCAALGIPMLEGYDLCGRKNSYNGVVPKEGVCLAENRSCNYLNINGGTCINEGNWGCLGLTVSNEGNCVANSVGDAGWGGCNHVTFTNGSICYANVSGACGTHWQNDRTTYDATSCCCGKYCGSQPKCADRGIACDPQYLK